jgi:hypothetical protein
VKSVPVTTSTETKPFLGHCFCFSIAWTCSSSSAKNFSQPIGGGEYTNLASAKFRRCKIKNPEMCFGTSEMLCEDVDSVSPFGGGLFLISYEFRRFPTMEVEAG